MKKIMQRERGSPATGSEKGSWRNDQVVEVPISSFDAYWEEMETS